MLNAQERNGVMVCQNLALDVALRPSLLQYVALNPFIAGEYYAVYGDGNVSWNFPTAWTEEVSTISWGITAVANTVSLVHPGGIAATIPGPPAVAPSTIPLSYSSSSDNTRILQLFAKLTTLTKNG
jgi:hypothetical protein